MAKFFDYFNNRPPRPKLDTPDPTHTKVQQHYAEQLEINRIMKRALNGGSLPAPTTAPIYGDFRVTDLRQAYEMIDRAESGFNSLPSDVRTRFANDPLELVSFVEDERNRDEAVRIGLIPAPPPTVSESDPVASE